MLPEMLAAVQAGQAALSTAKTVMSLAQEYGKVDLRLKVIDLTTEIEQLVHKHTELILRHVEVQAEVAELKHKLNTREELELERGMYFLRGRKIPGPFCTRCFDVDDQLVLMKRFSNGSFYYHKCPKCRGEGESPGDTEIEAFTG